MTPDARHTRRLFDRLFVDYNEDLRPSGERNQPLVVHFRPSLVEVLQLDENTGHMQMHMWMRMVGYFDN